MYQVGKGPNEVQVADLTGDGIDDIVTANYGSDTVSVLLGNGDGTFQPQETFAAGDGPASLYVADLKRRRQCPTSSWPAATATRSASSSATATARSSRR